MAQISSIFRLELQTALSMFQLEEKYTELPPKRILLESCLCRRTSNRNILRSVSEVFPVSKSAFVHLPGAEQDDVSTDFRVESPFAGHSCDDRPIPILLHSIMEAVQ